MEAAAGETPSIMEEVVGETHRGLECAQAHPLGNQHQRGPVSLWVVEGVTKSRHRVEQAPLLPLGPSPGTVSQRSYQHYPTPVNT